MGIRTHDPSNQPAKTHASDRTATVTGVNDTQPVFNEAGKTTPSSVWVGQHIFSRCVNLDVN
jgi:hypothetical protein